MNVSIAYRWKEELQQEFEKPYFEQLINFVKKEYALHQCYPPGKQIFAAFDYCSFDDVKVVIIGQDPYHGIGQANGLCFSVKEEIQHPPSLVNIFKEIQTDLGKKYPKSGNLERWAKQGVLLLNATLSVRAHQAGSHQNKGWETFTDKVIKIISERKKGIVFYYGAVMPNEKSKFIDAKKHTILESGHPSPLSANKGYWFGNKHFSKCNTILTKLGKTPINW